MIDPTRRGGEPGSVAMAAALERARHDSSFLAMIADRETPSVEALLAGRIDLAPRLSRDEPTARRLRLERRQLALNVAIGDLEGILDLSAVTGALTDFAD